tara:strand:+ start:334 stop:657 length:324 start_codon:yes stop_codon:yes gene_type:complete
MAKEDVIIMISSTGVKEEYPANAEEFLKKLCKNIGGGNYYLYEDSDSKIEEVIERYNNHPNKEALEECIEDITEGDIEWNMTIDHTWGFTNGYDEEWLFYDDDFNRI